MEFKIFKLFRLTLLLPRSCFLPDLHFSFFSFLFIRNGNHIGPDIALKCPCYFRLPVFASRPLKNITLLQYIIYITINIFSRNLPLSFRSVNTMNTWIYTYCSLILKLIIRWLCVIYIYMFNCVLNFKVTHTHYVNAGTSWRGQGPLSCSVRV